MSFPWLALNSALPIPEESLHHIECNVQKEKELKANIHPIPLYGVYFFSELRKDSEKYTIRSLLLETLELVGEIG